MVKKILFLTLLFICILTSFGFAEIQPLSLQQAIETALQNNPQIRKAQISQQTAQSAETKAQAGTYPAASLALGVNLPIGGTITINSVSPNTSSWNSTVTNASVNASYVLYDAGNITNSVKQAQANLTRADWTLIKTRENIKYDVTKAYYSAINAKNNVAVQKKALENSTNHLAVATSQYQQGACPRGDMLRSKVTVSQDKQSLIVAKNNYAKAMLTLKNIMNISSNNDVELSQELTYQPVTINQAQSISYALQNNPDVHIAQLAIIADEFGYQIAQAADAPTVKLTASSYHGFNAASSAAAEYTNQLGFSVGAALNFNLFDGHRTSSAIEIAKLQIDQDKQTLEQLNLDTTLNVNSAIDDIAAAYEVIVTAKTSLALAQEDVEIKQNRYSAGNGTNIDVLDAQKALIANMNSYYQAVYAYNLAIANLDKLCGRPVN